MHPSPHVTECRERGRCGRRNPWATRGRGWGRGSGWRSQGRSRAGSAGIRGRGERRGGKKGKGQRRQRLRRTEHCVVLPAAQTTVVGAEVGASVAAATSPKHDDWAELGEPTVHSAQVESEVAPSFVLTVPPGQRLQSDLPELAWNLPAGQSSHLFAPPAALNVPLKHLNLKRRVRHCHSLISCVYRNQVP